MNTRTPVKPGDRVRMVRDVAPHDEQPVRVIAVRDGIATCDAPAGFPYGRTVHLPAWWLAGRQVAP